MEHLQQLPAETKLSYSPTMYKTTYGQSYALIIGIDVYAFTGPLGYAVSDATAISEVLIGHLGFEAGNVCVLINEDATRSAILKSFLAFATRVDEDDRIIFFFAGHGHTLSSLRGDVGFLVPHDGSPADLSTLIRWDELTRNADLICAKHLLFLMDACYGGLAVTRAFNPGSMRFLRDMMQRVSRQVLTAGKANETVSDSGGPLPNHSVFTGHLLEALSGKAKDNQENLTANGVIAYVYQHVSSDASSMQTPHYGYLHGDGDMIFHPVQLESMSTPEDERDERLVSIPATRVNNEGAQMSEIDVLKDLLSEERHKIKLHDFMSQRTREVLARTGDDNFAVQGVMNKDVFLARIVKYEEAIHELIPQQMLLGRWGNPANAAILQLPLKRLTERLTIVGGSSSLIDLRWYPIFVLLYSGGLGALIDDNYANFYALLHMSVPVDYGETNGDSLLVGVIKPMFGVHDLFKLTDGHDRALTPRSEYLFHLLQPAADDTLFVGNGYEMLFNRVELLLSIEYAHLTSPTLLTESERVWGPIGRFGWRGQYGGSGPLQKLIDEAKSADGNWKPLVAGFCGASLNRFIEIATALQKTVSKLGWF